MTPICITGSAPLPAQCLDALKKLGLQTAQALPRDPAITLQTWHDKVLQQRQPQPGRVWEQLAAELLLANIGHNTWAWADPQSLHLLDFWANFDPSIRFVLLAETPAQALLRANPTQNQAIEQVLEQWCAIHQRLLHFALRHPQRASLVWSHQATAQAPALAQHLASQWALDWTPQATTATQTSPNCPLAEHLANHASQQYPQVGQLWSELQACVTQLGTPDSAHSISHDTSALLARYQTLHTASQQNVQIKGLQQQLEQANKQHQASQQALTDTRKQLQTAQSQAEQIPKLQQQLQAIQQQLQVSQQQSQTSQQQLLASQQQQQSVTTQLQDLQKQLQQSKATAAQLAILQAQLAQQGSLQAQLDTLQQNNQKLQTQYAEAQEDADTLLAQLHETQEELESYCIENEGLQQLSKDFSNLQQRWAQLFAAHPELYAVERVSIEPVPSQAQHYSIGLHMLSMAGRHFDTLQLLLGANSAGSVSIQLHPGETGPTPLLRWPTDLAADQPLVLHPDPAADNAPQRFARLIQLSGSDWQLCHDLPRLLLAAIQQGHPHIGPTDQATLQTGLNHFIQALEPLQAVFRFDAAYALEVPTPERLQLQIERPLLAREAGQDLNITLEHQAQHTPQAPAVHMRIGANSWLGNTQDLMLEFDATGWHTPQQEPLQAAQANKLKALLTAMPLVLVEAVNSGADKAQLRPWADTVRQLRNLATPGTAQPAIATASSAKAVAAKPTKAKAPRQRATTAPGPTLQLLVSAAPINPDPVPTPTRKQTKQQQAKEPVKPLANPSVPQKSNIKTIAQAPHSAKASPRSAASKTTAKPNARRKVAA